MRRAVCALAFCLPRACFAQDLIVMPEGDSLNCKITRVRDNQIYFTFTYKGEVRNSMVSLSEAKSVQYGYYNSKTEAVSSSIKEIKPQVPSSTRRWRFSGMVGYGYRLGSVPDVLYQYRDYFEGLKSGFTWDVEVAYNFSDNLHLGGTYRMFKTSNSAVLTFNDGSGNSVTEPVSDNITISYLGPVIGTRMAPGKQGAWLFDFTLGYMQFVDYTTFGPSAYRLEGSTLGYGFGIGYEFAISEGVAMGVKIDAVLGQLRNVTLYAGGSSSSGSLGDTPESLSRFDFMVMLVLKK